MKTAGREEPGLKEREENIYDKKIPQATLLHVQRSPSHGVPLTVSWFQLIWRNTDMRKKNICTPEKPMYIR